MLSVTFQFNTMNTTDVEMGKKTRSNSEVYLLLIVVKLTVLVIFKLIRICAAAYTVHNRSVVRKHNNTVLEHLQRRAISRDVEMGPR